MNLFEKSKARGISSPYAKDFMAYDEVDGKIRVDYVKKQLRCLLRMLH